MKLAPQQITAIDEIKYWREFGTQQVFRLFGYAGTGKSQPLWAKVQTPKGPVRMGALEVGSKVFGSDGEPTTVLGIHPQGMKDNYRITFRDGFSTEASADHLWTVWTHKLRATNKPPKVMTTAEIIKSGLRFPGGPHKYYVPVCCPASYPEKRLPIPPYSLGAFIGDGTNLGKTPVITLGDAIVAERLRAELPYTSVASDKKPGCVRFTFGTPRTSGSSNKLAKKFKTLCLDVLSKERFIPKIYLEGSPKQRWDLLKGLMDTDGCSERNRIQYSTMSKQLADNVCTLVQSLGGIAIKHVYDRKEKGVEYSINIKVFENPFSLERKAKNWKLSWKNPPSRAITKIEPCGRALHQCISVAAKDGLYLTDNFIVTHNTTLAKYIAECCSHPIFCAFTGKAAYVLRQKGCEAFTIHQLIYLPQEKSKKRLQDLEVELAQTDDPAKKEELEKKIHKEHERLKSPNFILNEESVVRECDLIIVDEVSMVDERMARDLMSFDVPILVLGDPAQLPPVKGSGYFIDATPDFMLTDIHRQAADNPIIKLATSIRMHEFPEPDGEMVMAWDDVTKEDALWAEQIIVGKNDTRTGMNERMRSLLGRKCTMPEHEDRLVCLRNNHDIGLLNGAIWTVDKALPTKYGTVDMVDMVVRSEDHQCAAVTSHMFHFNGEKCTMGWWQRKNAEEFDYGYALTCHKSQGSQWDKVMVFDESGTFSNDRFRWLYTAVTRAAKELKLVVKVGE